MQSSASSPQASPQSEFHFLDYWRIIRIRKTVILAVWLLVVLTTAGVTFLLEPTFSSFVRIEIQKDVKDITPIGGQQVDPVYDPYFMATEFEKIVSTAVLMPVINTTTNAAGEKLKPEDRFIPKWSKRLGLKDGQLLTEQQAFTYLKKNITVEQSRNTKLVEITVFSPDPDEAATIANLVAASYRNWRQNSRQINVQHAIQILKDNLKQQDEEVNRLQKEVNDLRVKLNIPDTMANSAAANPVSMERERLSTLLQSLGTVRQNLVYYESMLKELKRLAQEGPEALRDAVLTVLPTEQILPKRLDDLDMLEQQLAKLLSDYGEENPDVVRAKRMKQAVEAEISRRLKGIVDGLQANVNTWRARYEEVSNQVAVAKAQVAKEASKYSQYFEKKRELENKRRVRDAVFMRTLQETIDASLPTSSIVRVIDPAVPSPNPVRPNLMLNLIAGGVLGLMLGIGLAFFIEYLDTSVKTIDDVERTMGTTVVGVIPQNIGLLYKEGPDSPHAEAYRVLRTNVLFSRKDPNGNTITVVSGGAGEGKSTTIFNLATVFAQNGERVLLVDSDLRRPSLHKFLGVSNSVGLTNYLLKQNTLEEVIQTTPLATLDFLPSGKLPSSALGIINSPRMKELVDEVRNRYDFVFFDAPPIMGVSDASVLASLVDMALLVVQYRKYPQTMTLRAKQMVEKVGGNLLGIVLNNINISQDSYYYYYSGYYYDYYYGSHSKDGKRRKRSKSRKSGRKEKSQKAAPPAAGAESAGEPAELDQKF
jgi:capsular exopolysaccharide synthesis family protein